MRVVLITMLSFIHNLRIIKLIHSDKYLMRSDDFIIQTEVNNENINNMYVVIHERTLYFFHDKKYYTLAEMSKDIYVHLKETVLKKKKVEYLEDKKPVEMSDFHKDSDAVTPRADKPDSNFNRGSSQTSQMSNRGGNGNHMDSSRYSKGEKPKFNNNATQARKPSNFKNYKSYEKTTQTLSKGRNHSSSNLYNRMKMREENLNRSGGVNTRKDSPNEFHYSRGSHENSNSHNEPQESFREDKFENDYQSESKPEMSNYEKIMIPKEKENIYPVKTLPYKPLSALVKPPFHLIESDSSMDEQEDFFLAKDVLLVEIDGTCFNLKLNNGPCVTFFESKFIFAPCSKHNENQKFTLVKADEILKKIISQKLEKKENEQLDPLMEQKPIVFERKKKPIKKPITNTKVIKTTKVIKESDNTPIQEYDDFSDDFNYKSKPAKQKRKRENKKEVVDETDEDSEKREVQNSQEDYSKLAQIHDKKTAEDIPDDKLIEGSEDLFSRLQKSFSLGTLDSY